MFAFAPSSLYDSQYLREPRVYLPQPKPVSPRDRYLAALAEAQSAEAEYVAVLAREKAIQKQREEQHRKVELQRQRQSEAAIRKQLLLEEALYSQDSAPYYADDSYSMFPSTCSRRSHLNPFDSEAEAEAALLHELGRRRAVRRQRQEELVNRRRLAILRQQQEESEQALTLAAARRVQEVKRREQQAKLSRHSSEEEDLQQMLSLLFGGRATVIRKQPSQEKLVHPQANPAAQRQSCGSHCAPHRQPISNEQNDVEQLLKLIFGGQSEAAPHCRCASEEVKEKVAQPQFQPTASAQKAHAQSSPAHVAAASSSLGPSLKEQLQSRLNHEPESDVRDTVQGLLSSIFGPGAKLDRKERVEKKNKDAAATTTTPAGPSTSSHSLKEQLEARLYQNPRIEVHDTIQAILASLMTQKTEAARTSASVSKDAKPRTDATATTSSSTRTVEGKGKGKEVSFDVPTVMAPTSKDVVDSMNAIHNIQAAFNTLSADFSFPTRLDFTPPSSTPSSPHASDSESISTSQLAYTSTNAPVRYYEQALSALLTQLDAVESWGNEDVRKERKELVARVEATLEEVEREVQERFIHRQAREGVEVEEARVEDNVQADDVPTSEVQDAAVPTPVEELATAVVVEAVETPTATEDVSALAEQQSADNETIDSETSSSIPSDENVTDHSKEITNSVNDISVSGSSISVDEFVASPSEIPGEPEESSSANSSVTLTSADKDALRKVENATLSDHQSYSPTSQISTVIAVAEQASEDAYGSREESEPVDTFLLPAATDSPIIKRPAVHDEDELVVIDKEHGEASDGENWSEVEA